jgi:DNA-binding response OmpR family regulator
MRLLVIEDEPDLADALAEGLRAEGYAVDVAYDGIEALRKAEAHPYDAVTLDLGLPGIDGQEVCRRLHLPRPDAPDAPPPRVVLLTARDGVEARVAGLDAGADDYLVKPFAFPELAARIRAVLRRPALDVRGAELVVGDLRLDPARRDASRAGQRLPLTPKEFALLRYLMSRPGRVVSETELLQHVWDEHANPFTNTVRVTVSTLRRKLAGAAEGQPIETIVGAGYRVREA